MSRSAKRSFLLHKVVSSFLLRIPNLRKPNIPKLLLFKKFRIRIQKQKKEFKLLRHYNYGFLGEYEFSPSRTPRNIRWRNHRKQGFRNRGYLNLCSLMCLVRCLKGEVIGGFNSAIGDGDDDDEVVVVNVGEEDLGGDDSGEEEEDEESVDQRAERFIERFYEEMKIQRQESL
ncbi:uncharacterized protein G2W53_018961 [Senna tora]|uniref:Cotton fiber protein n=1 Tax=Senna tora TaxID=362788 RepID=A0A834WLT1_9FABA|nr:uncharacterized protein G2W53_018961 [Senna tora]